MWPGVSKGLFYGGASLSWNDELRCLQCSRLLWNHHPDLGIDPEIHHRARKLTRAREHRHRQAEHASGYGFAVISTARFSPRVTVEDSRNGIQERMGQKVEAEPVKLITAIVKPFTSTTSRRASRTRGAGMTIPVKSRDTDGRRATRRVYRGARILEWISYRRFGSKVVVEIPLSTRSWTSIVEAARRQDRRRQGVGESGRPHRAGAHR